MPKRSQKNLAVSGEEGTHRKASSGTIKSDSGIASLKALRQIPDREPARLSVSTMKAKNISQGFGVGSSVQVKMEQTRFPKLEEYAHFHYDFVEIPSLKLSICADDASGYKHNLELSEDSGMFLVTVTGSAPKSWLIKRSLENFATLDIQLHRCIFDRRFSHLHDLNTAQMEIKSRQELQVILQNYLCHLSELAGGMVNCGSVLSWMEMDNRGHRLVATDDSGINTPAIAAAHVIKRYNAQAADEISLQVGDMISVIDMPSAEDTIWWRGKRGFEVGFFPGECVEVIGDKVPNSMASRVPEPLATAAASRRPLMKKHGKLLSFLRTFFSHRPPRNQLKQSGIVKERVFGCDLGEHLLNSGHDVPLLLKSCTDIIEEHGIVHGIYRLSGITSNIQKLRLAFDEDRVPDLTDDCYLQDIHSISSLLKMYFRELPNPLLTYQLYDKFADAVRDEENKLLKIHDVVQQLPPPHYRTTEYLMRHLARVAAFGHETEMHSKNLAIVWAPNLLRSKELEAGGGAAALQGVGIQAVVTECLICYCDIIFNDKMPSYSSQDSLIGRKKARPKSLAISTPTRLLSLEEARERAFTGHLAPKKFIDVGGGPRNLPSKYHTVIDLPGYRKRAPSSAKDNKTVSGNKKMSTMCAGGGGSGGGGWKSIFTKPRSGSIKKTRKFDLQDSVTLGTVQAKALTEEDVHNWKHHLRSAKSAESLFSLINTPSSNGGSIFSNTDIAISDMQEHYCIHKEDKSSRHQLSHKRSLSSDASTILHHGNFSTDVPASTQPRVVDGAEKNALDKQSFIRGDSTRKALHRRLPSAPGTPQQDRKPGSEALSPNELTDSDDMADFLYNKYEYGHDINIDEQINSRLLQVAEQTRSAKSNEELTTHKRLAKSSPTGRKKAKGASNFHLVSNEDEFSPSMQYSPGSKIIHSPNDITDIVDDNSRHLRMLYSHFHDYAEILSDDDMGIVRTPESQGTMSVSSSGCNMQDVLDQIDTRLAQNAQLFPRQGIGDTSDYRVGDPLFCVHTSDPSRSKGREIEFFVNARKSGKTPAGSKQTEFPADMNISTKELCNQASAEQFADYLQSSNNLGVHNNQTHHLGCQATNGANVMPKMVEWGICRPTVVHKAVDKTNNGAQSSTLVGRRHAEFIPSMTATAQDLQNLNELLDSLEEDNPQINTHIMTKVVPKAQKPGQDCSAQIYQGSGRVASQRLPTSADSFESKIFALEKKVDGSGGMSKCLSVPSDIARSLENVTESQSDMLSSVTISELSVSINSFSNSLGQDAASHSDETGEDTDPRHRRSTSLDSLTESDHLMTRTLREINRQMEAAFRHNQINSSDPSLNDCSHHHRLVASDLDLEQRVSQVGETVEDKTCTDIPVNDQSNTRSESSWDSSQFFTVTVKQQHSDTALPFLGQSHLSLTSLSSKSGSDSHLDFMSASACLSTPVSSILDNTTVSNVVPATEHHQQHVVLSCSSSEVRDKKELNTKEGREGRLGSVENVHFFSRQTEKQTNRQNDEHIVIETKHVVKLKSSDVGRLGSVAASQKTQSDIANVCKNRSSSSSSSDTSSEELDRVAELYEGDKCKRSLTLPLKNMSVVSGRLAETASCTSEGGIYSDKRKNLDALNISLPPNDYAQYQVVRRQHSPRVEQRSPRSLRFNLPTDSSTAWHGKNEEDNGQNYEWRPGTLLSAGSQMDDTETSERMSCLCAAGLMSQRVRLSRESSISSLQSPDASYQNVLSGNMQSPLTTPVKEALPDLIQSTTQMEGTYSDNRCNIPFQLTLYHPDEFSMAIGANVSSHVPNSQNMALHLSPSLPEVHCLSHAVVVKKSTLKKSSTDNSLCEVICPEISSHHNQVLENNHRIISGKIIVDNLHIEKKNCPEFDFDANKLVRQAACNSQTILQAEIKCVDMDEAVEGSGSLQDESVNQGRQINRIFAAECTTTVSQLLSPSDERTVSQDESSPVAGEVDDQKLPHLTEKLTIFSGNARTMLVPLGERTSVDEQSIMNMQVLESESSFSISRGVLRTSRGVDEERVEMRGVDEEQVEITGVDEEQIEMRSVDEEQVEIIFSSGEMEKEEAQNVLNRGRELLMSPELKHQTEHTEKSYQGLPSPLTTVGSPVRRTSFSKIPRPRQNSEIIPPRSVTNGGKRGESSLHSLSMTSSSVPVDTSPSSSSSSSSSSSRNGYIRRGSEASGGANAKRQCHIRRSSDTKLTDLQTTAPTSRLSSSSNRADISGMGRPVTSPRNRASDIRSGSTDISNKFSRIPLSHRATNQSHRGAEAAGLGMSKQLSKIPSPIPKPRKLSLGCKGNLVTIPAEDTEHAKQCMKAETSGRTISGKRTTVRREGDTSSRKSTVGRGMPDKSGVKLVIESQLELKKIQTVHATKVSQPTRQLAEPDPVKESRGANICLDDVDSSSTALSFSGSINTQYYLQAEEFRKDENKKTPPPVATRKFHYDSRSLPRWSRFLESQSSFSGQTSDSAVYSDMLGSRSSLDDSVLQLAAERHDQFVPEISGDGRNYSLCVGSLRVKRSQKMQSLMDLFEHGSDSNMSDNSGTHSPGTQHRVRTYSGSTLVQGGLLTPCIEVGRGELSTTDDDTFLPLTSNDHDQWSREKLPFRAGTGVDHDESRKECTEGGRKLRTQRKPDDSLCSSATEPQGRQALKDRPHETADFLRPTSPLYRTSEAERLNHQYYPSVVSDVTCAFKNSKPPQYCFSSKFRTNSDSSTSGSYQTHHPQGSINVTSSRPSSCSEIDLYDSQLRNTNQASVFDRQQSVFTPTDPPGKWSETTNDFDAEKNTDDFSDENIPPPSARRKSERRNSIKELRQLFERPDPGSSISVDIEAPGEVVQLPVIRSRVRSISPHTDHGHEARREKVVRLSLEIPPTSVSCPNSQPDIKTQPLRLGPKPFYGALK